MALNYESSLGLHFTNAWMLYDIVTLMQAVSIPKVLQSRAWDLGLARGQLLCWRDERQETFQQGKAAPCMGNCQVFPSPAAAHGSRNKPMGTHVCLYSISDTQKVDLNSLL